MQNKNVIPKKGVAEMLWKDPEFLSAGVQCTKAAKAIVKCAKILLVPGVSTGAVEFALYSLLSDFCRPNNITPVIHEKLSVLLLYTNQGQVVTELIGMMRECLFESRGFRFKKLSGSDKIQLRTREPETVNIATLKRLTDIDARIFEGETETTITMPDTPPETFFPSKIVRSSETLDSPLHPTKVPLNPAYEPVSQTKQQTAVNANADCVSAGVRLNTMSPGLTYKKARIPCLDRDLDARIMMSFGDNPANHKKFEDLPEILAYTETDTDYSFIDDVTQVPTKYSAVPANGKPRLNVMDFINGDVEKTNVENVRALLPVILHDSYFSDELIDKLLTHHKIDTTTFAINYTKCPTAQRDRLNVLLKHTTTKVPIPEPLFLKWSLNPVKPKPAVVLVSKTPVPPTVPETTKVSETPKVPETPKTQDLPPEEPELDEEDYTPLANPKEILPKRILTEQEMITILKTGVFPQKTSPQETGFKNNSVKPLRTPEPWESAPTYSVNSKGGLSLGMTPLAEAYSEIVSYTHANFPHTTPTPAKTPVSPPAEQDMHTLLQRIATLEKELNTLLAKLTEIKQA